MGREVQLPQNIVTHNSLIGTPQYYDNPYHLQEDYHSLHQQGNVELACVDVVMVLPFSVLFQFVRVFLVIVSGLSRRLKRAEHDLFCHFLCPSSCSIWTARHGRYFTGICTTRYKGYNAVYISYLQDA